MKYLYLLVFALIFSSCNRNKYLEIDGTITGLSNGAVEIKDPQGTQLISALVSDGKFHTKALLPQKGFYDLFITPDLQKDYKKKLFEVYLESGNYTINSDADKIALYPRIKSDSKIQNELSDYYSAAIAQSQAIKIKGDSISDLLYGKNTPVVVGSKQYNDLQLQLNGIIKNEALGIDAKTLNDYVVKNPQNNIEAFLLSQIDYKKNSGDFYHIYQKFTPEQKNTLEGKNEGEDFDQLMKLSAGSPAPKISGKTLDGKAFDTKTVSGKKVILVEFWQSNSDVSQLNHVKLLNAYAEILANPDFGIVSISLDTKREDWISAVQKQKLSWVQVSDLQGQSSLNVTGWSVSTVPTYDLVDGNWNIIKRDIDFANFPDEIHKVLK